MHKGPQVSLPELLDSRELRAATQKQWADKYGLPLVSFTVNMVGPVKRNQLACIIFEQIKGAILGCCWRENITVERYQCIEQNSGYEMLLCLSGKTARQIKQLMVEIEEQHKLGRLADIDVLNERGEALSRSSLELPVRSCLICRQDAKVCGRSRAHSVEELLGKMQQVVASAI